MRPQCSNVAREAYKSNHSSYTQLASLVTGNVQPLRTPIHAAVRAIHACNVIPSMGCSKHHNLSMLSSNTQANLLSTSLNRPYCMCAVLYSLHTCMHRFVNSYMHALVLYILRLQQCHVNITAHRMHTHTHTHTRPRRSSSHVHPQLCHPCCNPGHCML
jgi:hypothetical protein